MDLSETDYCFVDNSSVNYSFEDDDCYFVNIESDSEFCFIEDQDDEEDFCIIEKQESLTKPHVDDIENLSYKEESEDEYMRKSLTKYCIEDIENFSYKDGSEDEFMRKSLTNHFVEDIENLSFNDKEGSQDEFMRKSLTNHFVEDIENLSFNDKGESQDEFMRKSLTNHFVEDIENLSYNNTEESEDKFMRKLSIHRKKLLNIFKMEASNEETIEYIKAYIKGEVRDPMFIYALTISITESLMTVSPDKSTLTTGKSFFNDLRARLKIVKRFVDNDDEYLGMKVILGIQQLSFENGHPEGFAERCFNAVYDVEIIHEGVFAEWEINEDPKFQLGKGACLSSASRFLNFIKDDQCYNYYLLRGF